MQNNFDHFFNDMLGICSKTFKHLHEVCEKYKNPLYRPEDSENDEGKKSKKTKKKIIDPLKSDPNAPKKPIIQAYLLYYAEVRQAKQGEHSNLPNQDITKLIAEEWNNLPKDKKEAYEIKARVNRQQYEAVLDEYLNKNPEMKEKISQAKVANRKSSQSGEAVVQSTPTSKPKSASKILASSSDEDDAVIQEKPVFQNAQVARKRSSSDDDSDDSDDDSSDSNAGPKVKKKFKA